MGFQQRTGVTGPARVASTRIAPLGCSARSEKAEDLIDHHRQMPGRPTRPSDPLSPCRTRPGCGGCRACPCSRARVPSPVRPGPCSQPGEARPVWSAGCDQPGCSQAGCGLAGCSPAGSGQPSLGQDRAARPGPHPRNRAGLDVSWRRGSGASRRDRPGAGGDLAEHAAPEEPAPLTAPLAIPPLTLRRRRLPAPPGRTPTRPSPRSRGAYWPR